MNETKKSKKVSRPELDKDLDNALAATFPASDPVNIATDRSSEPDRPIGRRPAKIDQALVDKLAREVSQRKGAA